MESNRDDVLVSLAADPYQWYRVGRGHYFEFDAADNCIAKRLETDLQPDYAPYCLIATVPVKNELGERIWKDETFELRSFLELRRRGATFFWIRSMSLTPHGDISQIDDPTRFCSLAGMINIQLRHPNEPPTSSPPSIGMVRKAAWLDGTHLVEHVEYYKIYQRLKRAFKDHIIKRNRRPPKPAAD